jgi:hypothetical protein
VQIGVNHEFLYQRPQRISFFFQPVKLRMYCDIVLVVHSMTTTVPYDLLRNCCIIATSTKTICQAVYYRLVGMSLAGQINDIDHGWEGDFEEDFMGREDASQRDEILEVGAGDPEDVCPSISIVSDATSQHQENEITYPVQNC